MASTRHLRILGLGVSRWNKWRATSEEVPDLSGADLRAMDLRGVDFRGANLEDAIFLKTDLREANLSSANLASIHLEGCRLENAILPLSEEANLLKKSVNAWNQWRDENKGVLKPDLRFLKLADRDLKGANLRGVDLSFAALTNVRLESANLMEADLRGASLKSCSFSNTRFDRSEMENLDLSGASLERCQFVGSRLRSASLRGCVCRKVDLRYADLSKADLTGASLVGADFRGARVSSARLEDCNLRESIGLQLDDNFIRGSSFSMNSRDGWSVLRRNYTGPRMVFFVAVLLIASVPYVFRAMIWNTVNELQERMPGKVAAEGEGVNSSVDRGLGIFESEQLYERYPFQEAVPGIEERESMAQSNLAEMQQAIIQKFSSSCLAAKCVELPTWKVLLRIDQGWLDAVLTIFALLYYGLRGFITIRTSLLREEEERSGYSPPLDSYHHIVHLHWVARFLGFLAFGMFVWRLGLVMFSTVALPA